MTDESPDLQKIEAAIRAQEDLHGILPDEQIEAALADLREQRRVLWAGLEGQGAIAQGQEAAAVGNRGAMVKGSHNLVITGDNNEINLADRSLDAPDALRLAYLSYIYTNTGTLALSGIDRKAASEAEARLNLGAIYTALLTLSVNETLSQADREWEQQNAKSLVDRLVFRIRGLRSSVVEQLNGQSRLVLLGDPGSGKSTVVNFAVLCMAGAALGKEPNLASLTAPLPLNDDEPLDQEEKPQAQPWDHGVLLPARVILRDFAARGLPPAGQKAGAKHLWDFLAAELAACALGDYIPHLRKEFLERGGLLMLDGLDEVPEADRRREQIKAAVEDFGAAYPKVRILVTSRTYAYQKQDWRLNGFTETVLAPFTTAQICQFVDRWYAHIAILRNLNTEDAQGHAEMLKRAIRSSDRLQELAERPLLLTLMASLHAWRGGTLPEKREELYADTVDLLLDWWESPKVVRDARGEVITQQPSLAEWLKVDRQKVRGLLNELAYRAHAGQPDLAGTADIPEADLITGFMHLSQNPDVNPVQLVEFLTARAGLLLPRGVGIYTFPHRTFQEYLAACHLTDHGYPDEVARLARQDPGRWREVCLLAGAKAARGGAFAIWPLVDALCTDAPGQESISADTWGAFLAGQTILDIGGIGVVSEASRKKIERVREWQVYILEKGDLPIIERARVGETLAAIGDPRFDPEQWYLPKDSLLGFVHIQAGKFIMGSKEGEGDKSEQPQHEVQLGDYWIAKYPVTVAQFNCFCAQSKYQPDSPKGLRGISNRPVTYVTWHDAVEYCNWLNEKMIVYASQKLALNTSAPDENVFWTALSTRKLALSLPSEAEWEKAARGTDGRIYSWGNTYEPDRANLIETGLGQPISVGCFPKGASPYGILDLAGNIREWTRSLWGLDYLDPSFTYPYDPNDGREKFTYTPSIYRVLRGGDHASKMDMARCARRDTQGNVNWVEEFGFRIVATPA